MAACVEAILASVNPFSAKDSDLQSTLVTALKEVQKLQHPSVGVQRAVYKGVASLFERLQEASAKVTASPELVDSLKIQLFRQDAGSEAVRLLRADAIVAVARLFAEELRVGIVKLMESEPSMLVRDRLRGALVTRNP
jgi:hypothetical protein